MSHRATHHLLHPRPQLQVGLAVLAVLAAVACERRPPPPPLTPLGDLAALRQEFNAAADRPRLLVLLSPT